MWRAEGAPQSRSRCSARRAEEGPRWLSGDLTPERAGGRRDEIGVPDLIVEAARGGGCFLQPGNFVVFGERKELDGTVGRPRYQLAR